jgi:hypothetical protein
VPELCKTESARQHFDIVRCYRPLSAQSRSGSFAGPELAGRNPRVAIPSVTSRGVYVSGRLPRSSARYLNRGLNSAGPGFETLDFTDAPRLHTRFSSKTHVHLNCTVLPRFAASGVGLFAARECPGMTAAAQDATHFGASLCGRHAEISLSWRAAQVGFRN